MTSEANVRTAPFGGWPAECLVSERKFGTRVSRLYPLIHDEKRRGRSQVGKVKVRDRSATLLQAFSDRAFVVFQGERVKVRGTDEPIGRYVDPEEVYPA